MKKPANSEPLLPYCTLDSISNETDSLANNRIVVRVLHIWESRDFKKNNVLLSLDCLLLDEKDYTIQASVLPHRIHKFKAVLTEGKLFSIADFDVLSANSRYRRTNHSCKLLFSDSTSLDEVKEEQCSIGTEFFRIFGFPQLFVMTDKGEELPDVVAQVATFKTSENKDKANPLKTSLNLILTCTLDSGNTAYVSIWEDIASASLAKLTNHANEPVVVIATHLNPKKFMGKLYLNGTASTKLFFNAENTIVKSFRQSNYFQKNVMPSILNGKTVFDPTNLHQIEQIEAYVKEQGGQVKLFSCKAKVVDVVLSNGWHFISCTSCRIKMVKSGSKLMYETCGAIQAVGILRYRIEVIVDDGHKTAKFVIFDEDAKNILKRSASDLAGDIANNNDSEDAVPELIKHFIGKTFNFTVKVSLYNFTARYQSFTVSSMEEDLGELPPDVSDTQTSNRNTAMVEVENSVLKLQGDVSATSRCTTALKLLTNSRETKSDDDIPLAQWKKQRMDRGSREEVVSVKGSDEKVKQTYQKIKEKDKQRESRNGSPACEDSVASHRFNTRGRNRKIKEPVVSKQSYTKQVEKKKEKNIAPKSEDAGSSQGRQNRKNKRQVVEDESDDEDTTYEASRDGTYEDDL